MFAQLLDPDREKFTAILKHYPHKGSWDDFAIENEKESGSIFDLIRELYYLKSKTTTDLQRDQIQRWLWTCSQVLRSDLRVLQLVQIEADKTS
jgi:hypothetical protein